ncbi:heterokaryon incompatibility protein-domain-containing protein [Leptodontidium sp. 2 PMI_412]|nr:heterokaryon incompatibility protein-domain-containing protein [Leptodontidium sp. 2 PMI_412]
MSFCSSDHVKSGCTPDSPDDLQDLCVIDCATRAVVPAPLNCHYVALSYVWGKAQPAHGADIPSSPFPLVVEDSISVTVALGFQYLWVDRYCVDQNDNRKHIQLGQMDKIYSCAQLTIVAAAGEDANYGLPGVSLRSHQSKAILEIYSVKVVQIFPHSVAVLKNSSWSKRGWTY